LKMDRDPLDVPHLKLVQEARWHSCLGCHDFHGNHVMQTPTRVSEATDPAQIIGYFAGHATPYSARLKQRARLQRTDLP
jgi:hypothetical protein